MFGQAQQMWAAMQRLSCAPPLPAAQSGSSTRPATPAPAPPWSSWAPRVTSRLSGLMSVCRMRAGGVEVGVGRVRRLPAGVRR